MPLSPVINLPVRHQVLGVDVESLAPFRGFSADAYDVANVNGTLLVENPTAQKVRLVLPFPTERASAEVRVVSSDQRVAFKKRDGRAEQFVDLLRTLGEIPADQAPVLDEVRKTIREWMVADIELPAGQQMLRFHARQILRPINGDARAFELELYAPLAGFILAPSGQSNMAVTVELPPPFAAHGMHVANVAVTPLPGRPEPSAQPFGPTPIAERPIYGWLWRNDPKVTISYRYS